MSRRLILIVFLTPVFFFLACDAGTSENNRKSTEVDLYDEWSGEYEGDVNVSIYDSTGALRESTQVSTYLNIDITASTEGGEVALMQDDQVGVEGNGVVQLIKSDTLYAEEEVTGKKIEVDLSKSGDRISGKVKVFDVDSGEIYRVYTPRAFYQWDAMLPN